MAGFTITINAQTDDGYTVAPSHYFPLTDCAPYNASVPLGLIKNTNTYDYYYLLTEWTNINAWKTLKFRNIVYSNPTALYLADTAIKIPEAGATVYNFDITGQGVDVAIPNLTLEYDAFTITQNETITFELAVEDALLGVGEYTPVTMFFQKITCPNNPPVQNYTVSITNNDACSTEASLTVHVPAEEERRVKVTPSDSYGFPSATDQVINIDTGYFLIITGHNGSTEITSSVLVEIYIDAAGTTLIDSYILKRKHNSTIC